MDIYYILFICCLLVLPLDLVRIGWPRNVVYIGLCLLLIAIPGLRAPGIDNDSSNYDEIFHVSQTLSFGEIFRGAYWQNTERGFMALNKLVSLYSPAVTAVFLVCAIATGYLNYRFFYKNARLPFFALLMYVSLFFFYHDMTQIRYALSCAITFFAVKAFRDKAYWRAALLVAAAALMHNTALIFVAILPLVSLIKNRMFYVLLPLAGLAGIFFNFFALVLAFGVGGEHMEIYRDETGRSGLLVPAVGMVILIMYYVYNRKIKQNPDELYFRLASLGTFVNLLFIQSAISQRFSHILFQFGIIVMSDLLYSNILVKRKPAYVFTYVLFAIFFMYYGMNMIEPTLVRPYTFAYGY